MAHRRVVTSRSQLPRQRYAEELRRLRAQQRLTYKQLGDRLGWDPSMFSKLEKGETLGGPEVAEALDQFYGSPGLLLAMWEVATGDRTQFRERYRRYMELEAESVSLSHFAVSVLPGLFQTPGYARELLTAGGLEGNVLEQQVKARIERRELLEGMDAPPFRVILSETVLRTAPSDKQVWREQLEYLVAVAERPKVTVHVLPFGAGLHGLDATTVMFLRLADGHTVAYVENASRGELMEENAEVEHLQRVYDAVRDLALSPAESRKFILRVLEEASCDPSI